MALAGWISGGAPFIDFSQPAKRLLGVHVDVGEHVERALLGVRARLRFILHAPVVGRHVELGKPDTGSEIRRAPLAGLWDGTTKLGAGIPKNNRE
jgi:hypothetical protein